MSKCHVCLREKGKFDHSEMALLGKKSSTLTTHLAIDLTGQQSLGEPLQGGYQCS